LILSTTGLPAKPQYPFMGGVAISPVSPSNRGIHRHIMQRDPMHDGLNIGMGFSFTGFSTFTLEPS
jgi:hypothetical protein